MSRMSMLFCSLLMVACSSHAPAVGTSQTVPEKPKMVVGESVFQLQGQGRVTGEYLITLEAGAEPDLIKSLYAKYGIRSVRKLDGNLYQVNLEQDPGPEVIDSMSKGVGQIKATQPNFTYRIN